MNKLIILLFLCSCAGYKPKTVASLSKGQQLYKRYWTKKDRHYNCVRSFVRTEVQPLQANTICIDIFRKEF
jgi:hypothetical protein